MSKFDKHHLLFERSTWTAEPHLTDIRTHAGLIIRGLPVLEIHRPLHAHIRHGVPVPTKEAAVQFTEHVVQPYQIGQPLFQTVDQAIGWFAMTDNQPTAEHLYEQREFIISRLAEREVA